MLPLMENDMENHFGIHNKHIKAKKRQLERARRQKINERLEKLKVIVMKRLGNDVGFYPPMEKADILELAIRCLEGKEQPTSSNEDKEKKTAERKPLERLQNNTPSLKEERNPLQTTPIRMKYSKTISRFSKSEPDENLQSQVTGELPAEFKPLLQHPIRAFSVVNKCDDVIQIYQSNRTLTNINVLQKRNTIWRPWTL